MSSKQIFLLPSDPAASKPVEGIDVPALWRSVPSSSSGSPIRVGTSHLFYDVRDSGDVSVVSSLGDQSKVKDNASQRETVRKAVGSAVGKVKSLGEHINGRIVNVNAEADPHAAGRLFVFL